MAALCTRSGDIMSLQHVTVSQVSNIAASTVIAGSPYTLESVFTSFAQQDAPFDSTSTISFGEFITSPSGVSTPIVGTATSENGFIQYDTATNEFTVLKSSGFAVKTRQRALRVGGNQGESELFVQAQVSVNGGATWLPTGNAVDIKLDDSRQVEIFFDFSNVILPAGVKLRQIFGRSANGTDFGSLVAGIPSSGLIAAGVTNAPAAQVSVYVPAIMQS